MNTSVTILQSRHVESGLHTLTRSPLGYFSSVKRHVYVQLYDQWILNSFCLLLITMLN